MKPPKVTFNDCWTHFVETDTSKTTPVSKEYDKARSCLSKKSHPSMEIAKKALAVANKSGTGEYHIYPCRFCKMFHIGHAK